MFVVVGAVIELEVVEASAMEMKESLFLRIQGKIFLKNNSKEN